MRIANLGTNKLVKIGNLPAGACLSVVDSCLVVGSDYYIVTAPRLGDAQGWDTPALLCNVVTGELLTVHKSSKCIVHSDSAVVIDFIDRS